MCNLLEEKDVTNVNLSIRLEQSVIQHQMRDDGSIYITEDGFYPSWVRVIEDRGLVALTTYTFFRKNVSRKDMLNFCNLVNCNFYFLTAFLENEKTLKFEHYINFRDGLLVENFVRSTRNFCKTIRSALSEYDPDDMCLPPGETDDDAEDLEEAS